MQPPVLTKISNEECQLQRLRRNQRDISQLHAKLRSYICEPKTYEQFLQQRDLKDKALALRRSNDRMYESLKNNLISDSEKLNTIWRKHINDFDLFRENTIAYLKTAKSY